jgi:DNA primase
LLDSAQPLIDYQVRLLGTREDMRSEPGLRRVVKAVQQTISAAPGAVQRDQLLNQAARGLGLNPDALRRDLARNTRRRTSRSAPAPGPDRVAHPREETALAQLLVQNPGNVHLAENYLPLDHLADPDCRAIVVAAIRTAGDDDPGLLMAELTRESDECRRLAAELLAAPPKVPGEMFDPGEDVKDCILRIWRKRLDQARRDLMTRAQAAEGAERERLMVERSHLTMDMERLRQGWASAVHILELNMSGYGGMAEPPAPHPS